MKTWSQRFMHLKFVWTNPRVPMPWSDSPYKRTGEGIYATCAFLWPIEGEHDVWVHTICIQCMDKKSHHNLTSLEKWIDFVLHTVEADFDKKEAALKITPITDALGFTSMLFNTRALLAWALFISTLLTQDLYELNKMVFKAKLQTISNWTGMHIHCGACIKAW